MAKRYLQTVTREEAIRRILEHVKPIKEDELLPVSVCKHRVTARSVFARFSNPPFVCSAMDGYAASFAKTRDADFATPVALNLDTDTFPVNTGDPLPKGTDAVIMIEEVEQSTTSIIIRKPVYLWQNVRMVGEDVIQGDMLLPANHKITTLDMGMLLSGGLTHVHVRRKPRILIIPTGKELIDIYETPLEEVRPEGLIDFNSSLLVNMAEDIGFHADKSKIARDRTELEHILKEALKKYDVIAINAGSSAGTEDYTEGVIRDSGRVIFHGVSMMPGKPTLFGVVEGKPVFGIPGYPVSAVTSFNTFLEPACEKLCATQQYKKYIKCITPYKVPSRIGVEEVLRINITERLGKHYAFPLPRGASVFSSMARADALMWIPENIEGFDEGEEVLCELTRAEEELHGRIHIIGSHDLSLDILRDMLKIAHPEKDLISTHVGSMSGILAFKKGIIELCTTHVLDEQEKVYNVPIARKYLPDRQWMLVHVAKRMQGLLVKKENPKNISDISDLARSGVTFVNRQYGSGTRILLDAILKEKGIEKSSIQGYEREESSHTAVGILVKESVADCGVAIFAVARAFSLGFIPLVEEDYDLLVAKEFVGDERFRLLMDLILSQEFKERLREIGGYNTEETGKVKYVQE